RSERAYIALPEAHKQAEAARAARRRPAGPDDGAAVRRLHRSFTRMTTIRPARDDDAQALPAIERSAGQLFREIADLAWIADGDDLTVERHRELIAKGTSFVAVDHDDRPVAFLSAEVQTNELHIWELSVRHDRQASGIGRALMEKAIDVARM